MKPNAQHFTANFILIIAVSTLQGVNRSFSKLKLILSYLADQWGKLVSAILPLTSALNEKLPKKINFDNVIDQFATAKSRKMNLL